MRLGGLPARPVIALLLAPLPAAALALAWWAGRRGLALGAAAALGAAFLLHVFLQIVHAWRLD